jgi:hypothetical protein
MAIDVFVMPLQRYFLGDFTTSLEQLAASNQWTFKRLFVGMSPGRVLKRYSASRRLACIESAVRAKTSRGLPLPSDDNIDYNAQAHNHHALMQYLRIRKAGGTIGPKDLNQSYFSSDAPYRDVALDDLYPCLGRLDVGSCICLPIDFDGFLAGDRLTGFMGDYDRQLVSVHAVERDLMRIQEHLPVPADWDFKEYPEGLFWPMDSIYQWREVIGISKRTNKPIIFWG